MTTLLPLLAALAASQPLRVDLAPQRRDDIEATLSVVVPEEGPGPARARLLLTLTVTGHSGLEVEGPRLEDALAGWRIGGGASSWREEDGRVVWAQTLRLEQVKPGNVPPPGVVVRVRDSPGAGWQELAWMDLLHEPRDVPPPAELPPLPASPWPRRLRYLALALVCGLALVLGARAIRRRLSARRPEPAHLRALARLEPAALPPADRPAERFAWVDRVVRDYLDEQLGLKTRQQTRAEVLAACEPLPPAARQALRELLERGELVKFAGQAPPPAEWEGIVEQAREVIRACAAPLPVGEGEAAGGTAKEARPG